MCGIAGFMGSFPPFVETSMADILAHRGPDGDGVFRDESAGIALVHRRLAILDLTVAGRQPMADLSGRYTMVFNGEIYNFHQLRNQMLPGVQLRSQSDSEVLIECFARRGRDILPELNGIFAFAVWDARERCLTLARDGAGVKPLYLYEDARGLAFASEIKALLPIPDRDERLDPIAAAAYLSYLWSPGERTMFRAVRKLAPGTCLTLDSNGRQHTSRFYQLPSYRPNYTLSPAQAIAGTRQHFMDAVERQMVADTDVGAFLSGGLDSSAIVAHARPHARSRLQCFTVDYTANDGEGAEMVPDLPYAQRTAQALDVNLHTVRIDAGIADEFSDLIYMLDEPQADPAALNSFHISSLARRAGIKVLLSGAGGDDIFTGYRRHHAASFDRMLDRIPEILRRAMAHGARHVPGRGVKLRRIRKLMNAAALQSDDRLTALFEWLPLAESVALLTDPVDPKSVRAPLDRVLATCSDANPVERVLRIDQEFFLTDHNLNYTDKTGMAAGVEVRVPFLDPELMAFAASIPTSLKIRDGLTKWVFRKAMEPDLPYDTIYRPKTGFGVPLRSWLRGPMRELVEDITSRAALERQGLFNPLEVERLRQRTFSGEIDGSYPLLAVISIELWCRHFLNGARAPMNVPSVSASALPLVRR